MNSSLTAENIWDAVIILALLEDCEARKMPLIMPQNASQKDRFSLAIRARNECIQLYGQNEVLHCCRKCVRFHDCGQTVSVVVTDGVTIGHPCCAVHNFHLPLASNRHRFCPTHLPLESQCAIIDCECPNRDGSLTCNDPEHQEVECIQKDRGQARFQLKERLEHSHVAHPESAEAVDATSQELADVDEAEEVFSLDQIRHTDAVRHETEMAPAAR
jgi:hypothetical protein